MKTTHSLSPSQFSLATSISSCRAVHYSSIYRQREHPASAGARRRRAVRHVRRDRRHRLSVFFAQFLPLGRPSLCCHVEMTVARRRCQSADANKRLTSLPGQVRAMRVSAPQYAPGLLGDDVIGWRSSLPMTSPPPDTAPFRRTVTSRDRCW